MKKIIGTLVVTLITVLTASAATEENIHETRPAKAGGILVVDVDFGSIDVSPGDNDKVVIDAHRKIEASSKEKEEEYLKAVPVTITVEGDKVIVREIHKHESLGTQLWRMLGQTRTEARYVIRVPGNFNTDLDTSGGSISANGLTGTTKANTSGGNLRFAGLHGPINAETSGGRVEVESCEGAIDVETSGGSIRAAGGSGSLWARTSGGGIAVGNFAGDAKVESSGGRLKLENIGGKINGETSGGSISAVLSAPVPGDVKLETSAGSIEVTAPANAALTVDAETTAGAVMTNLPMTTTHSGHERLNGAINGGGKLLRLRTSAGSIAIVSPEKETAQQ